VEKLTELAGQVVLPKSFASNFCLSFERKFITGDKRYTLLFTTTSAFSATRSESETWASTDDNGVIRIKSKITCFICSYPNLI